MSKKGESVVIWPVYIDSTKTRAIGRMVPKGLAVDSPSIDEIYEACRELNYNPVLEISKKMPAQWWEKPGRVLVAKKAKKLDMLKSVSKLIQKKRLQRKH
ncbi:MAG: signal recognition particle subunit SRP19/SEC65 family protein [Candidatus Methanomethylicus sp.]|nr:signal recognition particle subunit SRP19/SEC65 family protein [Candidatus Methanomethylicus sp.]